MVTLQAPVLLSWRIGVVQLLGPQHPGVQEPPCWPLSESPSEWSGVSSVSIQVPATEQALGLSTPAAAPAQAALPPNNRASRNAPRQRAVRPQVRGVLMQRAQQPCEMLLSLLGEPSLNSPADR